MSDFFRDYQREAVNAVFSRLARPGNTLVAMPTGTGKSRVIAGIASCALQWYPGSRVVNLTHVKELVGQNEATLREYWSTAPAGVYSSGLGRRELGFPITFAGIGSVAARPEAFGRVDLCLVDEAHTISPKETTVYRKTLDAWREVNPNMRVVGLTASPYRLGSGMLTEPGGVFEDICFDVTGLEPFNRFLAEGYLCPLIPQPTHTEIDVSAVPMRGGEFVLDKLQAAVDREEITRAAVAEMIAKGCNRKHWLVFAAGVEHVEHVAAILEEMGIPCAAVHSKSGDGVRDAAVADFKAGRIRALVNNGIFTTGFDFPGIDLIAVLRHTASPGLWVQMLGRGIRPVWPARDGSNWHLWPDIDPRLCDMNTAEGRLALIHYGPKQNCLVLDFANNTERCGAINDPILPRARKKGPAGAPPVKICVACGTWNHTSARFCIYCKSEFVGEVKYGTTAGTAELIRATPQPESPVTDWFKVNTVSYFQHVPKDSRPPSLRVVYRCGFNSFTEWVPLQSTDPGPAGRAQMWWLNRSTAPDMLPPISVVEALSRISELRQPQKIKVLINRTPKQVLHCAFDSETVLP